MTAEQLPQATLDWSRGKWSSIPGKYSREHTCVLHGGVKLRVSDSGFVLPESYRDGARVDPEKMFVATVASAHMLSWLHIAFGYGIDVQSYSDAAVGVMSELSPGVDQRSHSASADHVPRAQQCHGSGASADPRVGARAVLHRQLHQDEGDGAR